MIDCLLYAVRDALRNAGYGYSATTCEITEPGGMPPPRCGDFYVAVYQLGNTNQAVSHMDERFDFGVTLTMRVKVPRERIGERLLATNLARTPGPLGQSSFNVRATNLKDFLHEAWGILGDANNNLVAQTPDAPVIYGFAEPARFASMETPVLCYGDWFSAEPSEVPDGIKAELRFEGCRRLQPTALFI